jgi:hypothetical protein
MGDDDRGRALPGRSPLLDDLAGPAALRPRKMKPPPGIITAGGVDMARAHASGIEIRSAPLSEEPTHLPRVVLSIETDPRKVPTHRRLLEAREGARDAILPGGGRADPEAVAGDGGAQPEGSPPRSRDALPFWLRAVLLVLSLALVASAILRLQPRAQPPAVASRHSPQPAEPSLQAPSPVTEPPVAAPPPSLAVQSGTPRAPETVPSAAVPAQPGPRAAVSAVPDDTDDDDEPPPPPRPVKRPLPAPPPAPPKATATFSPPFQLPSEKN